MSSAYPKKAASHTESISQALLAWRARIKSSQRLGSEQGGTGTAH